RANRRRFFRAARTGGCDEFGRARRSERAEVDRWSCVAERDETAGGGPSDRPEDPRTAVVAVGGRVRPGDVPGLCARLRALLDDPAVGAVVCDVGGLVPDAVALEALAR